MLLKPILKINNDRFLTLATLSSYYLLNCISFLIAHFGTSTLNIKFIFKNGVC